MPSGRTSRSSAVNPVESDRSQAPGGIAEKWAALRATAASEFSLSNALCTCKCGASVGQVWEARLRRVGQR